MRIKFGFLLMVWSMAAFLVLGCNQKADQQTEDLELQQEQPGDTADTQEPQDPMAETDAEITAAVKERFMTDENVAARRIDVETENGVVTLRGMVATQNEAERAIELAKTAEGVRLVHSYLKTDTGDDTEPASTGDTSNLENQAEEAINEAGEAIETGIEQAQDLGGDAAITAQIKWKLAKDQMVQAADIDVDTKEGNVTLTGVVSNRQEVQRAIQIAQSVEDVRRVESNLRIR
jgi:hyperosmotically inducible protein